MAQEAKRRGRPREYDPDVALARATDAFWRGGYSATSLDELSAATGMHRPSLYAAFGDKRTLHLKALARYREETFGRIARGLQAPAPLAESLARVFAEGLAVFLSGPEGPRGCFALGAALAEAVGDEAVRAEIAEGIAGLDAAFEARFRAARAAGEIASDADPVARARMAAAILHSLAIRARAGDRKETLAQTAAAGVQLLTGARTPVSR
ncbi:MAG: TetR/AcrR family transcriptional regulator [Phenylobacterium sp.]|jgi:AcrR family transcriptional regulator|uniref:TetR/AcrR family transcriptional regulator n=1 Tax=Phenylobacterium sp. TaxID=1871053 RepID=UPI002A3712D7|nr:TetR/AcrR family transcriptional regulator [Phenylobacterium sp.]MDX9999265.1 TetR/AcrR family transcriptional regulator [Phenylobacterium sp.]